jgi:hypothetical protein
MRRFQRDRPVRDALCSSLRRLPYDKETGKQSQPGAQFCLQLELHGFLLP